MAKFLKYKTFSLQVADEIATLAIQTCHKSGFKPVAICVMDQAGYPIVTKRADGCAPLAYPKISEAKARACISTNMSSRAYGSKYLSADGTPDEFVRLVNQISTMGGKIAAFPGGVLVRSKDDGQVLGAVGVSGAAGAEDEYIALRAIHLCSAREDIMTEPEQHSCTTAKL